MNNQDTYTIPVHIKFEEEQPKKFYFDSQTTIDSIISEILAQTLLNPQHLLLSIKGKPITDTSKTLSSIGVSNNSIINAQYMGDRAGGIVASFNFNKLDKNDKVVRNFSSSAPAYRVVDNGLNLQAKCETPNCLAFNKYVIVQKGYGKFNIGKQIYQCICPLCHKETDVGQKIGYTNTKLIIKGRLKNKQKVQREEQAGNHYVTYKGGEKTSIVQWVFLQIEAKPLDS